MAIPMSEIRKQLSRDDVRLMGEAEALALRERVERILSNVQKKKEERQKRERVS